MPDEVRAAADVVLGTPFDAARALSALAAVLERETVPAGDPMRQGLPRPRTPRTMRRPS
jgi:hypothetical protein